MVKMVHRNKMNNTKKLTFIENSFDIKNKTTNIVNVTIDL